MRILLLVALFTYHINVFGGNLEKVYQDWPKAKELAKEQHKFILIDFYATWCGPCKRLNKEVFEDSLTAIEIAKRFILLKYDAEKDSAHHLTMKFHVNQYPTTIVLSHDGMMFDKLVGYESDPNDEKYLTFLQGAYDKYQQGQNISGVSNIIDLKFPSFYKKIVLKKSTIKAEQLAIDEYWKKNKTIDDEINFAIMSYLYVPDHLIEQVVLSKQELNDKFSKPDIDFLISKIARNKFKKAIEQKNDNAFQKARQFTQLHLSDEIASEYEKDYTKDMLVAKGDWNEFVEFAQREFAGDPSSGMANNFSWIIFEKCTDHVILMKAIEWMENAVSKQPEYAYLDTYAQLLYKAEDKQKGIEIMKKAIDAGRKNNDDVKESEKLLKQWSK